MCHYYKTIYIYINVIHADRLMLYDTSLITISCIYL